MFRTEIVQSIFSIFITWVISMFEQHHFHVPKRSPGRADLAILPLAAWSTSTWCIKFECLGRTTRETMLVLGCVTTLQRCLYLWSRILERASVRGSKSSKTTSKRSLTRWWQLKYFWFSPRKLGKMNPFWLIFFRWVETTNQVSCQKPDVVILNTGPFFGIRIESNWACGTPTACPLSVVFSGFLVGLA